MIRERTETKSRDEALAGVKAGKKIAQEFEPRIVGLLCNWCSYAGADLAGISRKKYAPNVRVVRVMCSGRVEPAFILKAFEKGADGVIVLGCHPGDCHYIEGNYKTMRRIPLLKKLLSQMGIEEERVRLEWVSASEGDRFAAIINEMTEQIRKLGPFSVKGTSPEYDWGRKQL